MYMNIDKLHQVGTTESTEEGFEKIGNYYAELEAERAKLAKELNIPINAVDDVVYLRSRQRHTPELEKQLIEKIQKGEFVNIMEFGVTPETQAALWNAALEAHLATSGN
jgi:hypothetical protein